ncbi:enoyl-CoA hydratase/isomerase family protein [Oscillochloris sp. ZM17-4]|uniref:enoyl-CoA hydratase/isomerase family protein n=1 Tax=Oscillochloris sp. ZM17-4 TaxID=2866714 RepID=UPI001C733CFC|nr:enoyl-CoA hydratase-related protein [Oscillochloris sp. ZM17-4]MBX0329520.1 enoyl-CoA hydratase/isomerase family protein [Oscillochloris sp. ZM17-4]
MSEQTILYAADGPIATITLSRPEVYNALNAQLHRELMDALRQAERDPAVRCVVITGAGKAFCSGQDLREFADLGRLDIGARLRQSYNPLVNRIRGMGKPVVAAVNGPAVGAGMSLALACDFRVAAMSASFAAAFVNIGLIPDSGLTYFLPRLIGQSRALELCMTGAQVDASTAREWGLVNVLAADDDFPEAVRQFATTLADRPAQAISLIKRALEMSQYADLSQVLEYEAEAQVVAGAHPDFAEGVAAFREKRPPIWK